MRRPCAALLRWARRRRRQRVDRSAGARSSAAFGRRQRDCRRVFSHRRAPVCAPAQGKYGAQRSRPPSSSMTVWGSSPSAQRTLANVRRSDLGVTCAGSGSSRCRASAASARCARGAGRASGVVHVERPVATARKDELAGLRAGVASTHGAQLVTEHGPDGDLPLRSGAEGRHGPSARRRGRDRASAARAARRCEARQR